MKKTARSSRIGLRPRGEKGLSAWWLLRRWQCARLLIKLIAWINPPQGQIILFLTHDAARRRRLWRFVEQQEWFQD